VRIGAATGASQRLSAGIRRLRDAVRRAAVDFLFRPVLDRPWISLFVSLQVRMGNGSERTVRFLIDDENGLTFAFRGFPGLGVLVALQFVPQDMIGLQMAIGRSGGVLVADIADDLRPSQTALDVEG
jgi:hypothetical protein